MPGCARSSSSRNCSSCPIPRAHRARLRPRAANSRAMPAPKPELAPVIRILARSCIRVSSRRLERTDDVCGQFCGELVVGPFMGEQVAEMDRCYEQLDGNAAVGVRQEFAAGDSTADDEPG